MADTTKLTASKTVWGGVLIALATLLPQIGGVLGPPWQEVLVQFGGVIQALGIALGVIGARAAMKKNSG